MRGLLIKQPRTNSSRNICNPHFTVKQDDFIRILLVDDDSCFLELTRNILEEKCTFKIDCALSVNSALTKIKQQKYDVIVSDYIMPKKNGMDLLKELCLIGDTTPFILYTCKNEEEIVEKVANLGSFRYFSKAGDPETVYPELISCIEEVVEESKPYLGIIEKIDKKHLIDLKRFSKEVMVLSFTHLSHICKFNKEQRCSKSQQYCESQNCPLIRKQRLKK